MIIASVSVSITPTAVLTAVLVAIALICLYRKRFRRELVYDVPTNYKQPPLPPCVRRLDSGIDDTNTNNNTDDQSPAHVHNVICQLESSTSQLEDGIVSPDSEVTVATSSTTTPNNSPPSEKNNTDIVNNTIIAQSLAISPDAVVSARPPSPTHSVEMDLSLERADGTDLLLNLEVGVAIKESTAENMTDECRVPTPDVAVNALYQPSTNFNFERNSAYGTDVAIAPEIQTSKNIAYEHSDPTM